MKKIILFTIAATVILSITAVAVIGVTASDTADGYYEYDAETGKETFIPYNDMQNYDLKPQESAPNLGSEN